MDISEKLEVLTAAGDSEVTIKELRDRLNWLAAGDTFGLLSDERVAIRCGKKIQAMQLYRQRTQASLQECKDRIEAFMRKEGIPVISRRTK